MKPLNKIWLDGKIVSRDKAHFLNFHQGLNYGGCVYEGIRLYQTAIGPAIFRLPEHVDRFFYSASTLRMKISLDKDEFAQAIKEVARKNKMKSGYLRPIAFYSEPKMGINILNAEVTLAIFAWPWKEKKEEKKVTMKIVKYRRLDPDTVDLRAKIAGYYVNGILGFIEAREDGFDEPLFLDKKGYVAEGAVNNIFVIKGNSLYTPLEKNILTGVTRKTVMAIGPDLKLKVYEKNFRPEFLRNADEIFLTGTGIELERVMEISECYSQKQTTKSVLTEVLNYYRKITRGEVRKYKHWLTPIF